MLYLDTSVVVALLTAEPATSRVAGWLRKQDPAELVISDWVIPEFSSALSLKLRTRQIEPDNRAEALAAFARLCAETLDVLSVSRLHFRTAAQYTDHHMLAIRAADALHLAICADFGATLATLDRRLGEAGSQLGIPTVLV